MRPALRVTAFGNFSAVHASKAEHDGRKTLRLWKVNREGFGKRGPGSVRRARPPVRRGPSKAHRYRHHRLTLVPVARTPDRSGTKISVSIVSCKLFSMYL